MSTGKLKKIKKFSIVFITYEKEKIHACKKGDVTCKVRFLIFRN